MRIHFVNAAYGLVYLLLRNVRSGCRTAPTPKPSAMRHELHVEIKQ
jgi:hypothetical protein